MMADLGTFLVRLALAFAIATLARAVSEWLHGAAPAPLPQAVFKPARDRTHPEPLEQAPAAALDHVVLPPDLRAWVAGWEPEWARDEKAEELALAFRKLGMKGHEPERAWEMIRQNLQQLSGEDPSTGVSA